MAATSWNAAGYWARQRRPRKPRRPLTPTARAKPRGWRAETRELVEKEYAVVREADLARLSPRATTDECRCGRGVVWSSEWTAPSTRCRQNPVVLTEAIEATSTDSAALSGGSNPGNRWASMLFPDPGGPIISMLWPPAAAITSARFA